MAKRQLELVCKGTKKDGAPCPLPPLGGSEYCRHHQPRPLPRAINAEGFTIAVPIGEDLFRTFHDLLSGKIPLDHEDALTRALPDPPLDTLVLKTGVEHITMEDPETALPLTQTDKGMLGVRIPVTLFPTEDGIQFAIRGHVVSIALGKDDLTTLADITERNHAAGLVWPGDTETPFVGQSQLPPQPIITEMPFATFAELGAVRDATYDLARGRLHCRPVDGEIALAHHRPGARHSVKIAPSPLLEDWWGQPLSQSALEWAIGKFGEQATDAIKTLYMATGVAMNEPQGSVAVNLNDFLPKIGLQPRSTKERMRMLRDLAAWFTAWDGFSVHGTRSGERYVDPRTGLPVDTTIDDPLFRITGRRYGQRSFDNSEPPLAIYITPGAFLQRFRGMPGVLQYFGELQTLTQIKSGKASGEWAFCIGSSLRQLWRQLGSSRAIVAQVGEDKHDTIRGLIFTRRQIFTINPPTKYPVEEMLADSKVAARARQYWEDAIRELKQLSEISYYREVEALPTEAGPGGRPRLRESWQEAWLTQPLEIRPGKDGTAAIVEINRKALTARKTRTRKRRG